MMKKQLLIVAHHLTIGGVQKTLISALKALNYNKYDVTLYLRKNRTDLLPYVDNRVSVIVNNDTNHYYRKPYAIFLQIKIAFFKLLGKNKMASAFEKELFDRIRADAMEYERKSYFADKRFDIAVAYVQGYTALFVDSFINADKKIVFYHTSTDDLHSLHESILPNFDKIAALHDGQKELIKQWFPKIADKISIVENYIDKELIEKQSLEFEIDKKYGITVLCSCGRFSSEKGFDLAVEAARILKEKNINFLWFFVGDGFEKDNMKKLIDKYGLNNQVVLTGMQKNPYPYIAACDIFVQPSYEEALGLTMLEAHRLFKPIVSTKTVGGMKIIKNNHNGLICDINAESLASGIEQIINDKELNNAIKENLRNTDFSSEFDKYREQWSALLEE